MTNSPVDLPYLPSPKDPPTSMMSRSLDKPYKTRRRPSYASASDASETTDDKDIAWITHMPQRYQSPEKANVCPTCGYMNGIEQRRAAISRPSSSAASTQLERREAPDSQVQEKQASQARTPKAVVVQEPLNFVVVGGTGSGKSCFIDLLSKTQDRRPQIGHSLSSCTSEIEVFPCEDQSGRRYNLIDTPGFDDSRYPDAQGLTKVANFLVSLYERRQQVHGVIFIHRITDIRLPGSSIKTAQIIQRVCGARFRGRYALVTSMWDVVDDPITAEQREAELLRHPQFWAEMCSSNNANHFRSFGSSESAWKVIHWFLDPQEHPTLLRPPVVELARQIKTGKLVSETDAGVFLLGELSKQRRLRMDAVKDLRRQISDARQAKDREAVQLYSDIHAREVEKIVQNERIQRSMRSRVSSKLTAVRG